MPAHLNTCCDVAVALFLVLCAERDGVRSFWPQLVTEGLALNAVTGRRLPAFGGDCNKNVVLHWAQGSDGPCLHLATALDPDVARLAMKAMLAATLRETQGASCQDSVGRY